MKDTAPGGFVDFVVARGPALHRTAVLLTRQEQAAEDLVQIALAKAWPSWTQIDDNPEAHVRRIMINEFAPGWPRRRRGEASTAELPERSLPDNDRDLDDDDPSMRQVLMAELATLTPRQRAMVVLRFFHNYAEAATAQAMGARVHTVKSEIVSALAALGISEELSGDAAPDLTAPAHASDAPSKRTTDDLRDALTDAADAATYPDVDALVAGARRRAASTRRRRLSALGAVTAVVLVVGGLAGGPGGAGGTVPSPHSSQTGSSLRQGQAAALEVLAVIDAYGLHAKEPGWTGQKQKFTDWVYEADSPEGILRALNLALRAGGGLHSWLFRQADLTPAPGARPTVTVEGQIAVVSVPANGGTEWRDYATALDEAIQQVRGQVCGWVVDLRPSTGGSVVPGFVGLSSLLPDGPVIALVDRDGVAGSTYSLAGSTLTAAPSAIVPDIEVPNPPFPRVPPSPKITQPVVVLQSTSTASAGEATVVAFKGRPQTHFVGQPTLGASSGNTALVGPFGSMALLTTGVFQDRAGVTYPEEPIPPQTVTAPGEELHAAKAWLQSQRCGPAGRG